MNLVTVFGICIITTSAVLLFRQHRPEYVLPLSLIAGGILLLLVAREIGEGLLLLQNHVSALGLVYSHFYVAMKALGICVITGFIADVCRDAGQTSLANKAELAGRCAVFILSLPMLSSLLDTAVGFIK